MKFYVDGKLITEAKSGAGPIATKPAPIMIAGQSGQTADGQIKASPSAGGKGPCLARVRSN